MRLLRPCPVTMGSCRLRMSFENHVKNLSQKQNVPESYMPSVSWDNLLLSCCPQSPPKKTAALSFFFSGIATAEEKNWVICIFNVIDLQIRFLYKLSRQLLSRLINVSSMNHMQKGVAQINSQGQAEAQGRDSQDSMMIVVDCCASMSNKKCC